MPVWLVPQGFKLLTEGDFASTLANQEPLSGGSMFFYRYAVMATIFILTLLCTNVRAYTVAEIFQPGGIEEIYQAAMPVAKTLKNVGEFNDAFKDFLTRIEALLGQKARGWQAGVLENFRGWICYSAFLVRMALAQNANPDGKDRARETEALTNIILETLAPLFEQIKASGAFSGDSEHFKAALRAFLNSHT